jgi:glycosyltransferase involved in cell wall biosynthesis
MFAGMPRPTISAILITRNETSNIDRCLRSVSWCDEIVVVDSESTDDTVDRCVRHGAKVVIRPFMGFGNQKNAALALATSDWVFSIDADEVVTPELRSSIERAITEPAYDAYIVRRRFFFLGQRLQHGRGSVDMLTRLIRSGTGTFSDVLVHEGLLPNGPTGVLEGELEHYSYETISQVLEKFNRYTTLAATEMRGQGIKRSVVGTFLWWPLYFVKFYVLHGHWRNGVYGFVWSALSSWYPFIKVAKSRLGVEP